MIPHFPDPLDGELLYSVLARFAERMDYPALYTSHLEMFGFRHGVPEVELPTKINRLVAALPPNTIHTAESLIQKNTMFPFYAPYLPERSYSLILQNIKEEGARRTRLRAGISAGRISPPEYFRTCPKCDEENIAFYGETYWKRDFQVKGVEVCPIHSVLLEPTNIKIRSFSRRDALTTAQAAQRATTPRNLDRTAPDSGMLLRIAKSASWLLDKNTSRPGLVAINRGYRHLLATRGYVTAQGWIRQENLKRLLSESCTPELLKRFSCELRDGGDGGWLGRLLRETEQSIAPLRHLLVLAVLDIPAEEFFIRIIPESLAPPTRVAFPCLNPICAHHKAGTISHFELKRGKKGFARIFECPKCHHRSSRPDDGQSIIRVVNFGAEWEKRLASLWEDNSKSLSKISTDLSADCRSVVKCALKLGLGFPRRGTGRCANKPKYVPVAKRIRPEALLKQKRADWTRLQKRFPKAGMGELHTTASGLYTWLYRHDRQWLVENSPARREFIPKNDRVDWQARDRDLVELVKAAVKLIRNERRRRITVRSIGMELGLHTLIQIHKDKLPRTKALLEASVESTEQFVFRRMRWVFDDFKARNARPNRSEIMRVAGIGARALQMGSVAEAIVQMKEQLDQTQPLIPPLLQNAA